MGNFLQGSIDRSGRFPARFSSLSGVREFVGKAASECGLSSKAEYAVQLAVDEAFSNIIEHAYEGESREEVECICLLDEDSLTVILRDCGHPFDPNAVPPPDLKASLTKRKAGGLGLYFMRQLMDEIHFAFIPGSNGSDGCNVLTMVKRKEKLA